MFDLVVKYDDGTEVAVTAGQREMAAWEMAGHGSTVDVFETKPNAFCRFAAYAALKRTGQLPPSKVKGTTLSFEGWSDMVDVVEPPDEEVEADPTKPGPPSAGSSGSRSSRGSRSRKS